MKVIVIFTFCCDNLWKSIVSKTQGILFSYFMVTLSNHSELGGMSHKPESPPSYMVL